MRSLALRGVVLLVLVVVMRRDDWRKRVMTGCAGVRVAPRPWRFPTSAAERTGAGDHSNAAGLRGLLTVSGCKRLAPLPDIARSGSAFPSCAPVPTPQRRNAKPGAGTSSRPASWADRAEHEDRRPGAADHRGVPCRAQGGDERVRARHGRLPVPLVQPVPGGVPQPVRVRRPGRAPAGRRGRRWRRRPRAAPDRAAAPAPRRLHRPSGIKHRRPDLRPRPGPRRPAPRRGPRTPPRARRTSPRPRCPDGPRSPSACRSTQARSSSTSARPAAATRPATMAADEDPRPRPCGMVLWPASRSPGTRRRGRPARPGSSG